MATHFYYSEMDEPRPECVQIDARSAHYGQHWFLTTPLELKGRGIVFRGKIEPGQVCGPRAAWLVGQNQYKVTNRAFDLLKEKFEIGVELLLD